MASGPAGACPRIRAIGGFGNQGQTILSIPNESSAVSLVTHAAHETHLAGLWSPLGTEAAASQPIEQHMQSVADGAGRRAA
jgi:hypothetical protein